MSREDLEKLVKWFDQRIVYLESLPIYSEIREGVERLKETVEGFTCPPRLSESDGGQGGDLDDFVDDALSGTMD